MNSYNNPFYRSLLGISEIDSVNSANINTQSLTVSSLGTGLVSSTSGTLGNATAVVPLSFNNNQLSIALTGSTGVTYDIVNNVGRFAFSPLTGSTGPIGTTGPQGIQGIQGIQGPQGDLGPIGPVGPQGDLGPTGFTGPIGTIGPQGDLGPTGYTGPQSLITSNFNVFGGVNSGQNRTTSTGCVGLGYNALSSLTTSLNNTAIGTDALRSLTTNAPTQNGNNTAVGYASLSQCAGPTGYQNTAIGSFSGSQLTTGRFNTLMGMSAGYNLTTGDTNFHLGLNSGYSNRTSNDNISIGAYSMARNLNQMTGPDGRNVSIGHYSAHSLEGYPTNNVSIGYNSMYNATQCSDNICIGTNSGNSIRSGGGNIAIGGSSLSTGGTLTNGQGLNIGLGIASNLYVSNGAVNNIGIGGYSNLNTITGANNISIGTYTQALSSTGCNNIVISTNGTSGTPVSGKGDNTALIDATNGLYSYLPAYAHFASSNNTLNLIYWNTTYFNYNISVSNQTVTVALAGLYEISLSGTVRSTGGFNVTGSLVINGAGYNGLDRTFVLYNAGSGNYMPLSVTIIFRLTAGSTMYVSTANVQGSTLARTYLTIKWISL